jgi:hypothetical protein
MSYNANDFKPAGSVNILLLSVGIFLMPCFPCKADMPGIKYYGYQAGKKVALARACHTPDYIVKKLIYYIQCGNERSFEDKDNKKEYIAGFFNGALYEIKNPSIDECHENEDFIVKVIQREETAQSPNDQCFYRNKSQ